MKGEEGMYKVTLRKTYMDMEFIFKYWADATLFMSLVMDNKDGEIDIKLEKIVEGEDDGE